MEKITENKEKNRFETEVDGKIAIIEYNRKKDKIYLIHTEVPPEMEGKGIASSLVKQVLQQIKDEGLYVIPRCPFIAAYIKRHPEWNEIVAND